MSYQDGLDWLARNVHKWPESILDGTFRKEIMWIEPNREMKAAMVGNPLYCYSKPQWLARRAEMQNKPTEWPDGANWLAQDRDGEWSFYTDSSDNPPQNHGEANWYSDDDVIRVRRIGEVLGDWRDTLERRPEVYKTTLQVDTPAERVQETAKSMGKWHERGELPPVGTKCEYRLSTTSPWYPCEIKYVIHDDGVVMMREDGFEQFCSINSKLQPVSFRPIRTERDDAIEAMKDHCPYPGSWETTYRLFAESLYDAGYRAVGFE